MRTRPRPDARNARLSGAARARRPQIALLVVVAVAATLVAALIAAVRSDADKTPAGEGLLPASAWYGIVGVPPVPVSVGQRVIVVLDVPSLAQRVARAGGQASERQERRWSTTIAAAQRQLIANLAERGVRVEPEFEYSRVLSGFSAALDAPAIALLERTPGVAGVYPVRVAYPAATTASGRPGGRLGIRLPGASGSGVTIALLDTGVDRGHRFLRNRVRPGNDVVSGDSLADAEAQPGDPNDVERHGTALAGILVGSGGPREATGLAPGARILPIRVAGWQPDAQGGTSVYARTDQLIAGLERAVDPNGDGDAHDAARVAVIGLAEPYAAFADGPEAAAVSGAVALDTVVVAPAGNNGPAGPRYGSIGGPGAAPAALTVGAAEPRGSGQIADVSLRIGLESIFDGKVPLAGNTGPASTISLPLALPRVMTGGGRPQTTLGLANFFDANGLSLVAGRAALVPGSAAPERAARAAVNAGARAVVVYGGRLPAGALDLGADVPVVGVPETAGRSLVEAVREGTGARVSIAPGGVAAVGGGVAAFSSRGLAFDGRLKPDLVAPGVALIAPEPSQTADATGGFGSISGTSAATAVAGAAVALLAQARPELDAADLRDVLVGSARPLTTAARTAQGAGVLDLGAAAAAELAAEPATLAFDQTVSRNWRESESIVVRNISTRPVRVRVRGLVDGHPRGASVTVHPRAFRLQPGKAGRLYVDAAATRPGQELLTGAVTFDVSGRTALTVPWAAAPGVHETGLLSSVHLQTAIFRPSDNVQSVLSFAAGRLMRSEEGYQVQAVSRLDLEVRRVGARKPLGLLAQLRHLLPGRYAFGLTGRGPAGKALHAGRYRLELMAFPTGTGPPTRRSVVFRVT